MRQVVPLANQVDRALKAAVTTAVPVEENNPVESTVALSPDFAVVSYRDFAAEEVGRWEEFEVRSAELPANQ